MDKEILIGGIEMKHCTNCGAEMQDDIKFCPACGAAQVSDEQVASQQPQEQQPYYGQAPQQPYYGSRSSRTHSSRTFRRVRLP